MGVRQITFYHISFISCCRKFQEYRFPGEANAHPPPLPLGQHWPEAGIYSTVHRFHFKVRFRKHCLECFHILEWLDVSICTLLFPQRLHLQ